MPGNTFPDTFETLNTVRKLGTARCSLIELPSQALVQFKQLVYLDARNNNITSIDPTLIDFFETQKVKEIYLDGNKVGYSEGSKTPAEFKLKLERKFWYLKRQMSEFTEDFLSLYFYSQSKGDRALCG